MASHRHDHRPLLSHPLVATWYDETALRSRLTAEVNLRRLGLFLHETRLTPESILIEAKRRPQHFHATVVRFAKERQGEGRLPSYVAKTFVGVKSWLRFNRVNFDQFPRLRVVPGESLREERVPTRDELRRILGTFTARARVVALMMAHAGVRPGVLASIDGRTGLTFEALPELQLAPEPEFKQVPFHIIVPGRLSKTSHEYHTFGTAELADAILAYLTERTAGGEVLDSSSPLIAVEPMGKGTKFRAASRSGFITTPKMMETLRKGLKAVLPAARTYVLRAYCSTQLVTARVDRDVREELLGHSLGVSGRYNLAKKLNPEMVEELRSAYRRAEPYLSTERSRPTEDEANRRLKRLMLRVAGYSDKELDEVPWDSVTDEEIERMVAERLDTLPRKAAEQVVPTEVLNRMLAEGWEFVATLSPGQVIVRQPLPVVRLAGGWDMPPQTNR